MKKLANFVMLLGVIALMSCETVEGPMGPQGPAGADGLIGSIFEAEVDFTASNGYAVLVSFPEGIELYNTDLVMAYVLQGVDNGTDIWEPLPQTIFYEGKTLLYTFDHTFQDINFFMDGTVDLNTLPANYTDGLVFRVAIIPAAFIAKVNPANMSEVMGIMSEEAVHDLSRLHP